MKIIKQGDLKRLEKTRRFECPDCGCIWEANAAEYRTEWDRNENFGNVRMPDLPQVGLWKEDT